MAALAALLEESAMRVSVARTALLKRQPRIFRGAIRHRMALLARDVDMRTGQQKSRFGVIEFS